MQQIKDNSDNIPDCKSCGNTYLAIRNDVYKDKRPFVYCDCCGSMGDLELWVRANKQEVDLI